MSKVPLIFKIIVNVGIIVGFVAMALGQIPCAQANQINNQSTTMHVGITLKPPAEGVNLSGIPNSLKYTIEDIFASHTGGLASYRLGSVLIQLGDPYKTGLSTQVCAKIIVLYESSNVALAGEACRND